MIASAPPHTRASARIAASAAVGSALIITTCRLHLPAHFTSLQDALEYVDHCYGSTRIYPGLSTAKFGKS